MSFIPRPHEIYKHFKGNLYQIVTIAEHSETGEQLVIYRTLYGDYKNYARPLSMFTDRVDKEKYPEAEQEFRFELQGENGRRRKAQSEPRKMDSASEEADGISRKMDGASGDVDSISRTMEDTLGETDDIPGSVDSGSESADSQPREAVFEPEAEEPNLDPLVMEFLDADTYEERLNILAGLHHRITDEMITTMAIACDVEVEDGDTQERYESLRSCLLTLEKYECNRIR